jgi:hypothetical protein
MDNYNWTDYNWTDSCWTAPDWSEYDRTGDWRNRPGFFEYLYIPTLKQFSSTAIQWFLLTPGLAATAAVTLRFLARWLKRNILWWDDWFAVASLAFYWCFVAIGLLGETHRTETIRKQLTLKSS